MGSELAQVHNGRVTWHAAVGHVATVLTPWGVAANIATQMGACISEIGRYKLEANRLLRAHAIVSDEMNMRHALVIAEFEAQRQASMYASVTVDAYLDGFRAVTALTRNMSITAEERLVTLGTMSAMSQDLVTLAALPGNQLIQFIKVLDLSRTEREIAALRQLGR